MIKSLFIISLALIAFCSCQSSQKSPQEQTTGEKDTIPAGEYRFIKIYHTPVNDSIYSDTTELHVKIDQEARVTGTYLWVLPGKDGKYGTISGYLSHDTVFGRYLYQQEGGNYSDSVKMVLEPERAIVIQLADNNYKLTDTLIQK